MQVKLGTVNLCVSEDREAGLLITHQPLPQLDTFTSQMSPFASIVAILWMHTWVRTQLFAGHRTSVPEKSGSH